MFTVTEVVYSAGALVGESSADGHNATATDNTLILIDRISIDIDRSHMYMYSAMV